MTEHEERIVALLLEVAAIEDDEELERFLARLPTWLRRAVEERWQWRTWLGQREPEGDWATWALIGGRGYGKTRAGAEWVWERARQSPGCRIALIGANSDDVYKVMVAGETGLVGCARTGEEARWIASRKTLVFPSGARGFAYSAETPDKLRGPQHHYAWCDEFAKWPKAEAAWDMLKMGLRLGTRPRTIVTTTPRPIAVLKRLLAMRSTRFSHGRMADNEATADAVKADLAESYGRTRLARQELDGELIEDFAGALWTRELIEASRAEPPPREALKRVVVGVDPPASAEGICGIVVGGLAGADQERIGYVLADLSVAGLSPDGWARRVAAAAESWGAERVVVEVNQGGNMVESVLRGADMALPVGPVRAKYGKSDRAEPVAMLFERGKAKLAGTFEALEDQLAGMISGGGYQGPGRSPDRADAMVWVLAELMLDKDKGEPHIRWL